MEREVLAERRAARADAAAAEREVGSLAAELAAAARVDPAEGMAVAARAAAARVAVEEATMAVVVGLVGSPVGTE